MFHLAISIQDRRVQFAILFIMIVAALAAVALSNDVVFAGHANSGG